MVNNIIETFEAKDGSLEVSGGAEVTVTLEHPEWRAGYSYTPKAELDLPNVSEGTKLISVKAGASGLVKFIKAAWYLTWSQLVTDEASEGSKLCLRQDPFPNDPCPFPPMIFQTGFFNKGLENFLIW